MEVAGVILRPDPGGDGVVLERPDAHLAGVATPASVLRWMARGDTTATPPPSEPHAPSHVDDPDHSDTQHWLDRNWEWSLGYYLWSRRDDFIDRESAGVADSVIERYRQSDGPAPAVRDVLPPVVSLPPPTEEPPGTFRDVLLRRATIRSFRPEPMPLRLFSALLWHGFAVVRDLRLGDPESHEPLRSFGCAFDVAVINYKIDGLVPGIWWYDISQHVVSGGLPGRYEQEVDEIVWGQGPPLSAAATLVIVADFLRYQWRYRHERALRNLYIDAGRLMHPLLLVAAAYKIGCFITPATRDDRLVPLLGLRHPSQAPLYTLTFGLRLNDGRSG